MLGEKMKAGEYADQATFNALIESFCTHARNLNEFLHESTRDDTFKAISAGDAETQAMRNKSPSSRQQGVGFGWRPFSL
jgi:hypothetical protein